MVCWLTTLSLSILRPFQQLRQFGDVDGYPPCLIPRHKIRSRPASRLIFVISVSERVPVVVLHNEARAVVIDVQGGGKRRQGIGNARTKNKP